MNTTLITTILTMLLAVLPKITDSKIVASIIETLINLVPIVVKEAQEVLPMVKNIIELLRSKELTQEQLDQLDVVSAHVDAAWDQALVDFEKENPDGGED